MVKKCWGGWGVQNLGKHAYIILERSLREDNTVVSIKKESVIDVKHVQKMSVSEVTKVVKKTSQMKVESFGEEVRVLDSIYLDDEYVVVEKKSNNWFMVGKA